MTPLREDAIIESMWTLHPVRRLSALILSIAMCNEVNTLGSIKGMLAVVDAMARFHSAHKRGEIANMMRDAADRLEHALLHKV